MSIAASSWFVVAALLPPLARTSEPAPQQSPQPLAQRGAPRPSGEIVRDRLLVKLARGHTATELQSAVASLGAKRVKPLFTRPPRGRKDEAAAAAIGLDRWQRVEFSGARADLEALREQLAASPLVEVAEFDRTVLPTVVPSDPDYSGSQWDLQPGKCDAETAWDTVTDSSARIVCVIDTGVEVTHPDIVANLWVNPGEIAGNGIDDEGNGFVDDVHGYNFESDNADVGDSWPHGMHVNGTIGADTDNATQVAGINWECQLMQGKIFQWPNGTWEAGAAATVYAVDNGASITNNSWGDTVAGPQAFVDAMDYAESNDVLQVAAAGNQGDTNPFWPAYYDEFLSVASTNSGDARSWFSTYGDWIDMSAPGEGIWNLWVGGSAASLSGTSMASPHVAGAAALVRTVNPQLDAHEARLALRLASDDLGTPGYDNDYGFGRLDIAQAVAAARAISLSKQDAARPDTITVTLDAPSEAGMYHVLLAGMAGNDPGIPLSEYDPADARTFPLNDDLLLNLIAADPFFPLLPNWFDLLDSNGQATRTFTVLKGKFFKDERLSFCFFTLDPADLSKVRFVSAVVHAEVH